VKGVLYVRAMQKSYIRTIYKGITELVKCPQQKWLKAKYQ